MEVSSHSDDEDVNFDAVEDDANKKENLADENNGSDSEKLASGSEGENDEMHSKKKKRKKSQPSKKAKKKRGYDDFNFFLDEAREASDSEEEEDDVEKYGAAEYNIGKEEQEAIDMVERRHAANREYLDRSADDIAREIESRHKQTARIRESLGDGGITKHIAVAQQSLLPSVMDPKIFRVKCKPGTEVTLVRSIMLKTIDIRNKGGLLKVKSAFTSGNKGFIYVEAISEAFAKEIIQGLHTLYPSSLSQVHVPEMTSTLNVTFKKKPLREGQWVRFKRGPLKGDLARIIGVFDGGARAFVQAVPRPDYSNASDNNVSAKESKKEKTPVTAPGTVKIRPQQRLFDPEEAKQHGGFVGRRHHALAPASEFFDTYKDDFYRDGFLFKEVNVATTIDDVDVKPRLEELQLFNIRKQKKKERDVFDDEDEDADGEHEDALANMSGSGHNFVKELAEQIESIKEDEEGKDQLTSFVPGDLVQISSGDLRNLIARIVSINELTKIVQVIPYSNALASAEMAVELDLLVKYVSTGAHVKVMNGRYMGQTGRVMTVNVVDGEHIAVLLTDGVNTEIHVNVSQLQMSTEVSTGYGNLMGYELYDLVQINENEMAVVIKVGAEKLSLINHMGVVKEMFPQELQGKKNHLSARAQSFDSQQNTIAVNDTVTVTSGPHAKQSGTIKHIMKGNLWLHNNSHLKNSGVFVVKARSCVVAGGKAPTPVLSASYKGVLLPTPSATPGSQTSRSGAPPAPGGPKRTGRDPDLGKTVRITKGAFKGLLGTVVDATPTHYSVELLAKLKKIVIERSKAVMADKDGGERRPVYTGTGMGDIPSTPFLTAQTPMHAGSETPRYGLGAETPNPYGEARTPRAHDDMVGDVWRVSDTDAFKPPAPVHMTGNTPRSAFSTGPSRWEVSPAMSALTPTSELYSPGNSSNYTASSPLGEGSAKGSFRDFDRNMIVIVRRGEHTGKFAVVQQRADSSGRLLLNLRESNGKLDRRGFTSHVNDIALAEPPKKEKVVMLTGLKKGSFANVKTKSGNDFVVEFPGAKQEKPELVKISQIAWVYDDSIR